MTNDDKEITQEQFTERIESYILDFNADEVDYILSSWQEHDIEVTQVTSSTSLEAEMNNCLCLAIRVGNISALKIMMVSTVSRY